MALVIPIKGILGSSFGHMKYPYRLILVDKDGVLVSEFQLTENDLAHPEAFVATLKRSIEDVEEEEP